MVICKIECLCNIFIWQQTTDSKPNKIINTNTWMNSKSSRNSSLHQHSAMTLVKYVGKICALLVVRVEHARDVVELSGVAIKQNQHVMLLITQHGSWGPQLLRCTVDDRLLCHLVVRLRTTPRRHRWPHTPERSSRTLKPVQLREVLICTWINNSTSSASSLHRQIYYTNITWRDRRLWVEYKWCSIAFLLLYGTCNCTRSTSAKHIY